MTRFLLIFIVWITSASFSVAQFLPTYTQYLYNGLALNSAYAGLHNHIDVRIYGNAQWVGLPDAPLSQSLSVQSPVSISGHKFGVGVMLGNYTVGESRWMNGTLSMNYKLYLNSTLRLSFGLQAAFNQFSSNLANLLIKDADDPQLVDEIYNFGYATLGAGLFLHSDFYFVSLSSHDLKSALAKTDEYFYPPFFKDILLAGGYIFSVTPSIYIKPNILLAVRKGSPVNISLNTSVFVKENLIVGLSYQFQNSIKIFSQFQLVKNLSVGYTLNLPIAQRLNSGTLGSHEIQIGYKWKLFANDLLIVNPRFL